MATTTNWGIVYPVVGNVITPLATQFANLANSTETALNATGRMTGTDAQRIALTAPRLKAGLLWYSTDTSREWEYTGSNWISNDGGSYVIWPTSANNGTINSDGTVSFTNQTSVSLNGIFSSRFRHTRVEVSCVSTSADVGIQGRLRSAGADSTSGYFGLYVETSNGTGPNRNIDLNTAFANIGRFSTSGGEMTVDFWNIFQSGNGRSMEQSMDASLYHRSGGHSYSSSSFDGFTFQTGSATTFTGSIRVYGYA